LASSLGKNYTLRESDRFGERIAALIGDARVWDDVQFLFDAELCRDPYCGMAIPYTSLFGLTVEAPAGLITVIYGVDEDQKLVILLDAANV
jgi:hypothetical protein